LLTDHASDATRAVAQFRASMTDLNKLDDHAGGNLVNALSSRSPEFRER
jgi:hypothetical protein